MLEKREGCEKRRELGTYQTFLERESTKIIFLAVFILGVSKTEQTAEGTGTT